MEFDKEAEGILIMLSMEGKYTADVLSQVGLDDFHDNTNKDLFLDIVAMFSNNEELSLLSVDSKHHDLIHEFMRKNGFSVLTDMALVAKKSDIPVMAKRVKSAKENRQLLQY